MRRVFWTSFSLLVFVLLVARSSAALDRQQPGDQQDPQGSATKTLKQKAKKGAGAKLAKESDPYRTWLTEEVSYIITEEEKAAFLRLSTNEEREQFIEEFWRRRNPDPDSPENTAREEHYRRIAYTNEHFSSGIPGWKTDRGHIYILWGPPDEIDSHAAGSTYDRPPEQGGGSTTVYAFDIWRYRHLEDIGDNIELWFVDRTGSGEYRLTMDPGEVDALAMVPGAGLSTAEALGIYSKAQRFSNTNGTTLPTPMGGIGIDEFENMNKYFRVQRPPQHLKDLEAVVNARIVRDQIHMNYRADFLRVTGDSVLVPITLQIPNRELHFTEKNGIQSATLNLYARITTLSGRVAQTFEEVMSCDVPDALFAASVNLSSLYQKAVPLRSGLYRLDVVVKDPQSGNVGVLNEALRVPLYEENKIDASSLILADQIHAAPTSQVGQGPFVLGNYKVRPRIKPEFLATDKMGIFLQLYNLQLAPDTHKTSVSVSYRVIKDHRQVWKEDESSEQLHQNGEQITMERNLPLFTLEPGQYTLEVYAIDLLTNQTITRTADFSVKAPAPAAKPGI
jgi:GWxTD domain-containing protein